MSRGETFETTPIWGVPPSPFVSRHRRGAEAGRAAAFRPVLPVGARVHPVGRAKLREKWLRLA
jgi:hypothetical protein